MSFEWNYDTYKNDENIIIMFFKKHPKTTSPRHLNQPHPILKTKQKSRKKNRQTHRKRGEYKVPIEAE